MRNLLAVNNSETVLRQSKLSLASFQVLANCMKHRHVSSANNRGVTNVQ